MTLDTMVKLPTAGSDAVVSQLREKCNASNETHSCERLAKGLSCAL
jgi:hypothetical protein